MEEIVYMILQSECMPYTPCELQFIPYIQNMPLNMPVYIEMPGQERCPITILEAAILKRYPLLVRQLLIMGASPNVSTSGVSLVFQLLEELPMDYQMGIGLITQYIIELLQWNGSYVPPGYPGTHGYLPRAIRGERF
jgi:hypothetical protein